MVYDMSLSIQVHPIGPYNSVYTTKFSGKWRISIKENNATWKYIIATYFDPDAK